MHLLFQLLCTSLLCFSISATLISKSELETCTLEEETHKQGGTCRDTIFITLVLHDSQGESESLYANIHSLERKRAGKKEILSLENPYRITVTKSPVNIVYNLQYVRSVNGHPREEVVKRLGFNLFGWKWNSDICGYSYNGGRQIPFSDGFHCVCKNINDKIRGDHVCNTLDVTSRGFTGHCLKMNNIYYDSYTMINPKVEYKISVKIESGNRSNAAHNRIKWTELETLIITPMTDVLTSKLKGIVARIHGDYATVREIDTFEENTLFIPSPSWKTKTDKQYKEIYSGGAKEWLMVPNSKLGDECNKIGITYKGFHDQDNRCKVPVGSCLDGQLWNLFTESKESGGKGKNKQGYQYNSYYLKDECDIHKHTSIASLILKCTHEGNHNTKLTLELNAEDIRFVKNIADARIVSVKTNDFEALSEHGEINIEIENLGTITSDYIISIKCPKGLNSINNRKLTIDAGEVKKLVFPTTSYHKLGKYYKCTLVLWDSEFTSIDSKEFNIKTNSTCYCISNCGCTCAHEQDPTCNYMNTELALIDRANMWKARIVKILIGFLDIVTYDAIVALIASCIISVGCIKLSFGRVCCCCNSKKKSKKSKNKLNHFKCTGHCRGALAAKKTVKLTAEQKEINKDMLLDWRAERFCCSCQLDQKDVMLLSVLASIYTVLVYPSYIITVLGRKIRMYVTK